MPSMFQRVFLSTIVDKVEILKKKSKISKHQGHVKMLMFPKGNANVYEDSLHSSFNALSKNPNFYQV